MHAYYSSVLIIFYSTVNYTGIKVELNFITSLLDIQKLEKLDANLGLIISSIKAIN